MEKEKPNVPRQDLKDALAQVMGVTPSDKTTSTPSPKSNGKNKILNLPSKELPIKPLTLRALNEAANQRVSVITKEFKEGFKFIEKYPKSVTVFGSARLPKNSPYYKLARGLTTRIAAELNYAVFTGGGPGIMEAANLGAFEGKGQSVGITIKLPHEQVTNPYLTDHIGLYYFFSRKVAMTFSAESYIYFPGGFGTLDEFFEILTLVQTNKIEKVPMILVGTEYWAPLEKFLRDQLLSQSMIDREDLNIFTITDDLDEIIGIIKNARVRNGIPTHYK